MDFQNSLEPYLSLFTKVEFWYQISFIIIMFIVGIFLTKFFRKYLATKRVGSQEIFKLILLGLYVHVEPLLIYLVFPIILFIGYYLPVLDASGFGLIGLIQIITTLIFVTKLTVSIINR